jgi:hypothetical protein
MALKLILMLVAKKGVMKIKNFGDSLVVINWLQGLYSLEKILLRPIFKEIQLITSSFNQKKIIMFTGKGIHWQMDYPRMDYS